MVRLIRELRRRKVFRGAAIYLVAAWAVLQVVDVVGEAAGLPAWTMRVLLYAALIGFPLAVFIGWRYEFGEHGLVKTKPAGSAEAQQALGARDYVAITVLVAVSVAAAWQIIPGVIESTPEQDAVGQVAVDSHSIAVLPFDEIGGAGDGFLADGLSETLTHVLGQVDGLTVTARTSAMVFKERAENVLNIARELRVAYVVEGSVQQAGSRIRVIARLVETSNGTELWSANLNKEVEDIFSMQDEISQDVVAALGKVLKLGENNVAPQYQPDLEAYKELVLGMNALRNDTTAGNVAAKAHFEKAIEIDPGYALAYIRLGEAIARDDTMERAEVARVARPLVDKALEIEPLLAEAHLALSMIHRFENRTDLVEGALLRALELNPSLAEAHVYYSSWLVLAQRLDESLEHARIAAELDPKNPNTLLRLSSAYWNVGRSEEAIAIAKDINSEFPEFPYSYYTLKRWYTQMGKPGRALLYAKMLYELDPGNRARLAEFCHAYWQAWDFEAAGRCSDEYLQKYPDDIEARKQRAGHLGNYDEAIRLAREHAELEPWSIYRRVQQAYFTSLKRDHEGVLEVLRENLPDLFGDKPTIDDFTQWPARMAAQALLETGEVEQAHKLLDLIWDHVERSRKLQGGGWFSGIEDVYVHALRGDTEQALDALEVAIDNGWSFYSAALADNSDPHLDSVVDNPRFRELVKRLSDRMAEERAWYETNKDQPLN